MSDLIRLKITSWPKVLTENSPEIDYQKNRLIARGFTQIVYRAVDAFHGELLGRRPNDPLEEQLASS